MLASLFVSRFGAKRALPLAAAGILGLVVLASGGRQTSIDAGSGTAQARIQHWTEGLEYWESSPLLGIGYGQYVEKVDHVAHNSYVHAFVETGYFGGIAFVGILFASLFGLSLTPRLYDEATTEEEIQVNDSRPFIVAALVGYCMGIYSLSRNYVIPTYLVVALANSCLFVSHPIEERTWFALDGAMIRRLALVGTGTLVALKVFVKVFVNYG